MPSCGSLFEVLSMAFDTYETGDGSPTEIITFQNGAFIRRICNQSFPVTIAGQEYLPETYTLSPFAQSKDSDDSNRTFRCFPEFSVVNLFNGPLKSQSTTVEVKRFHRDDGALEVQSIWKGRVVAVTHVDKDVEMLLQPVTQGQEITPPDTFSSLCNRFIFESPGCLLLRSDWRFQGTVTSITNGGLNLVVSGLRTQAAALDTAQGGPTGPLSAAELDTYWQNGHIETAEEIRTIKEGNVSGDPDAIRLDVPLREVQVGDPVDVFAGCDLKRQTCHKKFNNVINFQGYPDIPEIDPANTELPPGDRDTNSPLTGG